MTRRAIQIVDLGFGDSGKGTMVDYLVRKHEADLVLRFNGGPQAGHNVITPDGRHHTFSQFGSGTFVPGVRTLLSRFMVIEPYAMLNEARHLASVNVPDALQRTRIDERCLVIAPPQQIANRLRERARGAGAHGTCGMGFGECVSDDIDRADLSFRAGYFRDRDRCRQKLRALLDYKREALAAFRDHATPDERRVLDDPTWIETAVDACAEIARHAQIISPAMAEQTIRDNPCPIFEAAQGVLLDERYGFHPHTTWSTTTFANADTLLDEAQSDAARIRIGVLRTYMTRHGAGPMVSFDESLQPTLSEPHNTNHGWQGHFRRGVIDLVLLRYAIAVCGRVDGLALTHLDRLPLLPPIACHAYRQHGQRHEALPSHPNPTLDTMARLTEWLQTATPESIPWPTIETEFVHALEQHLHTPVLFQSAGPTAGDKRSVDE